MAELHRAGFTTVLTADTALQVGTLMTALVYGHLHELPHTVLVEHLEGVYLQDLLLQVNGLEVGDVGAAVTEGHLSQVVRTE